MYLCQELPIQMFVVVVVVSALIHAFLGICCRFGMTQKIFFPQAPSKGSVFKACWETLRNSGGNIARFQHVQHPVLPARLDGICHREPFM